MNVVKLELRAGPRGGKYVTKADMARNIEALQKAIDGKMSGADHILLIDTKNILEAIKAQLPG